MTRCRVPDFCERSKIDIGTYDPKSKRILPRNVKQRDACVFIHKNRYCVLWKKLDEIVYLMGKKREIKTSNMLKMQ